MSTPKWKTKLYERTGWLGFGLFILIVAIDAALAILHLPTFSQYVRARSKDQKVFGWIVIGLLVFLIIHWFWGIW
jgi:threonine/homoserine/homoserine lactone efflux protein